MENTEELHFYPSKVKILVLLIMSLILTLGFLFLSIVGFNEGLADVGWISGILTLIFIILFFTSVKRLGNLGPYLILTEEKLIINASSKNAIHLNWTDIKGYRHWKQHFNKFLGIIFYDESKVRQSMSKKMRRIYKINDVMNIPLFNIAWGQIRRKDRYRLSLEMDRCTFGDKHKTASETNHE